MTGTVTSADGTTIVFDRDGTGPVVVLVHGAFTGRSHPTLAEVARTLSPWFTVVNYDRRGRGESGDTRPYAAEREIEDLTALVDAGSRGDAVELFMVRAAEVPRDAVAAMRTHPSWTEMEALAHTLAYEAAVMGPGNAFPDGTAASIKQLLLVLNGRNSPAWMRDAGTAVAQAVPGAVHRVLDGQAHDVSARALAPELLEFFARDQ